MITVIKVSNTSYLRFYLEFGGLIYEYYKQGELISKIRICDNCRAYSAAVDSEGIIHAVYIEENKIVYFSGIFEKYKSVTIIESQAKLLPDVLKIINLGKINMLLYGENEDGVSKLYYRFISTFLHPSEKIYETNNSLSIYTNTDNTNNIRLLIKEQNIFNIYYFKWSEKLWKMQPSLNIEASELANEYVFFNSNNDIYITGICNKILNFYHYKLNNNTYELSAKTSLTEKYNENCGQILIYIISGMLKIIWAKEKGIYTAEMEIDTGRWNKIKTFEAGDFPIIYEILYPDQESVLRYGIKDEIFDYDEMIIFNQNTNNYKSEIEKRKKELLQMYQQDSLKNREIKNLYEEIRALNEKINFLDEKIRRMIQNSNTKSKKRINFINKNREN